MKQTAVEWLIEELDNNLDIKHSWRTKQYIEQAKQMEKEQIINAYDEGDNNGADRIYYHSDRDDKSAEQYYNENYGKM